MVFRYFAARLRRTVFPVAAASIALMTVTLTLVIALAMPQALKESLQNYNRQLCGNADLTLTNAYDSPDRFFGLSRLRNDEILWDNSEYIHGYYKTYAQIALKDGGRDFCTVFAASYAGQNSYNPIKPATGSLPENLTDGHIIIGEAHAREKELKVGSRLDVLYGGKIIDFYVICIAENTGLFYAGNAVFVSSAALERFVPGMGAGIVTHCFIKAKSAGSLAIISERLKTDYARLDVSPASGGGEVSAVISEIMIPSLLISAVAAFFCVLSLAVLLRLAFARDRENFALLSTLGMPRARIAAVTVMFGLLICAIGLTGAYFLSGVLAGVIRASSYLLSGFYIGAMPYAAGLGGGLAAGLLCAALGGRRNPAEKKHGKTLTLPLLIKIITDAKFLTAVSVIFAVTGFFLIESLPVIGLMFLLTALAGFIFFLPKAAAPLFSALHRTARNIYSLRLKTLALKSDWRRFASFGLAACLVALTVALASFNVGQLAVTPEYPFDIAVVDVRAPSDKLFDAVLNTEGVTGAVKCELRLNVQLNYGGLKLDANLIGLDEDGFGYFGADFACTAGGGAVIGRACAEIGALKKGDGLVFERGGAEVAFTVAEIIDSPHMNGLFVLADLAYLAPAARPYSEILCKTEGDADKIMQSLAALPDVAGEVIGIAAFNEFLKKPYEESVWLLYTLSGCIAALAAVTVVFMIIMRRSGGGDAPLLSPLGLSRAAEIKHNVFSVFCALLPLIILTPFFMLLISRISLAAYYFFGRRCSLFFRLPVILPFAAVFFGFVLFAEAFICGLIAVRKRIGG